MRVVLVGLLLVALGLGLWLSANLWQAKPVEDTSVPPEPAPSSPAQTPPGANTQPPEATAKAEVVSPVHFTTVATTGITFVHESGISDERYFPCQNGSGLGSIDLDRDGHYDLYFATGNRFGQQPEKTNRCYQNLGDWQFRDVTEVAGLHMAGFSAGVAVGDFDCDGFSDIYVTCVGRNQFFHNQGDGTFVELSDTGTNHTGFAASAVFFDPNNDGLPDLYVCNYGKWSTATNPECGADENRKMYCANSAIEPVGDLLYRNNGDGTFANISDQLSAPAARGQGAIAVDVNGDDLIDLYVGNDANANTLYTSTASGELEDVTATTGVAYDHRGTQQAGMGVAAADVNRDGRVDLMVTNFEREHNTLYLGTENRLFEDKSRSAGIVDGAMLWVGWGVAMNDLDLDAWPELLVVNGHVEPLLFEMGDGSSYEQPAVLWANKSGRFQQVTSGAGSYFETQHPSRGLLVTDVDNDGDADLIVGHIDKAPSLLRSDLKLPQPQSIAVTLVGHQTNRDAVGARVRVIGVVPELDYQVQGGGSYLSAADHRLLIASKVPVDAEVIWPGGRRSTVRNLQPGSRYVISQPTRGRIATALEIPE